MQGDSDANEASDGRRWQRHVNALMSCHYANLQHTYIAIPDKVHGDFGIEGFSTTGDAYQAYADDNSVSVGDRARKQKNKITKDLNKLTLRKNQKALCNLFQGIQISRWHLIVPTLDDKSVLIHARKKGELLREQKLPFLTEDFQAIVRTASTAFPAEARQLAQAGIVYIPDGYSECTDEDLEDFSVARAQQVIVLERKLRKVPKLADDDVREKARKDLLKRYLDSENLISQIRSCSPIVAEQIIVQRQQHARNLEALSPFEVAPASQIVANAKERFEQSLAPLLNSPNSTLINIIATGAIGLWLLECPLDFPEVPNG